MVMHRVIAIAFAGAGLAGCSSVSWDMFKSTPPPSRSDSNRTRLAPRPSPRSAQAAKPLRGLGSGVGCAVHGQLHAEPVSAGLSASERYQDPRRFLHTRLGDDRSKSGIRRAATGRAAETSEEAAPTEEAEGAESSSARLGGLSVPRPEVGTACHRAAARSPRPHALIRCSARLSAMAGMLRLHLMYLSPRKPR